MLLPWLRCPGVDRLPMLHPVRAGLVLNSATRPDVLDDLAKDQALGWAFLVRAELLDEPVPDQRATLLAGSRGTEIRAAAARSPHVSVDVRTRLAFDDTTTVREAAATRAWSPRVGRFHGTLGPPLPDDVYAVLATDSSARVRRALAGNPDVGGRARITLATDKDPEVRLAASGGPLPLPELLWLLADRHPTVREATRRQWPEHQTVLVPAPILRRYLPVVDGRWADVAAFVELTPDLLPDLMADPTTHTALARNPSLPGDAVRALADSTDADVRWALTFRPGLPLHFHDRLGDDRLTHAYVRWLRPRHAPLATRLSYLDSPISVIRRTVAIGPDLPADAVRRLASDDDFTVRLLLCECHPDAPGETLAEVAAAWPRSSGAHLVRHKNFPASELPRHARSEHARQRAAVADLPGLPTELARALLDDPEARSTAASNPTLPLDILRDLLDDPDPLVRLGAARNPALPPDLQRQLAG
jgi:hypothetical protein